MFFVLPAAKDPRERPAWLPDQGCVFITTPWRLTTLCRGYHTLLQGTATSPPKLRGTDFFLDAKLLPRLRHRPGNEGVQSTLQTCWPRKDEQSFSSTLYFCSRRRAGVQPGHSNVRLGQQPAPGCCLHMAEAHTAKARGQGRSQHQPAAGDVEETPAQ